MNSGPGLYLCGCVPELKIARYGGKRMENGVEVCPEHSVPLYGFLSPQIEKPGLGRALDYGAKATADTVRINPVREPDMRDNRDPLVAYEEHLYEKVRAGAGANGHA